MIPMLMTLMGFWTSFAATVLPGGYQRPKQSVGNNKLSSANVSRISTLLCVTLSVRSILGILWPVWTFQRLLLIQSPSMDQYLINLTSSVEVSTKSSLSNALFVCHDRSRVLVLHHQRQPL